MSAALALGLALLPGLASWWLGRRLRTDDPALAERVLQQRRSVLQALAVALALLVLLLPRHAAWAVPLLALATLTAGYPLRRRLHGETWDLVSFLAFNLRLWLALGAPWLLVLFAPALIVAAAERRAAAAGALLLLLGAWAILSRRLTLALLGARPLARPDLDAPLRAVLSKARVVAPQLFQVAPAGSRWANAFALPGTRDAAVAFSRGLLEAFAADEIQAVFAHEVAHLEHYDARRLRRRGTLQAALILGGCLLVPALAGRLAGDGWLLLWAWPLGILFGLLGFVARRRAHEADSDRRAVELLGDAEPLVRALTKLHALALVPRRFDGEAERMASHPSLANRIRAIRAAAGPSAGAASAAAPPPQPVVARAGGDAYVVLAASRIHWLDGVPAGTPETAAALGQAAARSRTLAYAELVELRVEPSRRGVVLRAVERSGQASSTVLDPGAVSAVQAALDTLEAQLAPATAAPPERRALAVLAACGVTLVGIASAGASAILVPGLLAIVLPHPAPLLALGAAALGQGLWTLGAGLPSPPFATAPWAPQALAGLGLLALWLGWSTAWKERQGRTRTALATAALLLASAALVWTPLGLSALDSSAGLRLHQTARDLPSTWLLPLAAAAALSGARRARVRAAALLPGLAALAAFALGTSAFADRFAHDPLRPPGAARAVRPRSARLLRSIALGEPAAQLRVSPGGSALALRVIRGGAAGEDDDTPAVSAFRIATAGGAWADLNALELRLLDEERGLALVPDADARGLALRLFPLAEPRVTLWQRALPSLAAPRLSVDTAADAWRVVALDWTGRERRLLRLQGDLAGIAASETAWPIPAAQTPYGGFVAGGDAALVVATRVAERLPPWPLLWLGAPYPGFGSSLLLLGSAGAREIARSALFAQCFDPAAAEGDFLCVADDRRDWHAFRIDARRAALSPLASLRGAYRGGVRDRRRLVAWAFEEGALTALDLDSGAAERIALAGPPRWLLDVALGEGVLGVLSREADGRTSVELLAF